MWVASLSRWIADIFGPYSPVTQTSSKGKKSLGDESCLTARHQSAASQPPGLRRQSEPEHHSANRSQPMTVHPAPQALRHTQDISGQASRQGLPSAVPSEVTLQDTSVVHRLIF